MDWNWFFSSLSQSSAAIVGVLGAFITTAILSNQSTFSQKSDRLRDLITEALKIADAASDLYIDWYNARTSDTKLKEVLELLDGGASEDANMLYDEVAFSEFMERGVALQLIRNHIELRKARIARKLDEERQKREAERDSPFGMAIGRPFEMPSMPEFSNVRLEDKVEREREAIDRVLRDARHHVRLIKEFLHSVRNNPESSVLIQYMLPLITVLFFIGVIYPLSFMPLPPDWKPAISISAFWDLIVTLRGLLLFAVSVIFTVIMSVLFELNRRMKYLSDEVERLEVFSTLAAYSKYFQVAEDNLKAGSAFRGNSAIEKRGFQLPAGSLKEDEKGGNDQGLGDR